MRNSWHERLKNILKACSANLFFARNLYSKQAAIHRYRKLIFLGYQVPQINRFSQCKNNDLSKGEINYVFLKFCTRGWHFIISIQILRLAKLWKRVENSCKQPGKEVLRNYLTDITTEFKQPFYLIFSLFPELFGAGSFKEEMLAERFSTDHRSLKQFCYFCKWPEIADTYAVIQWIRKKLVLRLTSLNHHFQFISYVRSKVSNCGRWRWWLYIVTLSNVIPALCTSRGGSSQQSQQCFNTASEVQLWLWTEAQQCSAPGHQGWMHHWI